MSQASTSSYRCMYTCTSTSCLLAFSHLSMYLGVSEGGVPWRSVCVCSKFLKNQHRIKCLFFFFSPPTKTPKISLMDIRSPIHTIPPLSIEKTSSFSLNSQVFSVVKSGCSWVLVTPRSQLFIYHFTRACVCFFWARRNGYGGVGKTQGNKGGTLLVLIITDYSLLLLNINIIVVVVILLLIISQEYYY